MSEISAASRAERRGAEIPLFDLDNGSQTLYQPQIELLPGEFYHICANQDNSQICSLSVLLPYRDDALGERKAIMPLFNLLNRKTVLLVLGIWCISCVAIMALTEYTGLACKLSSSKCRVLKMDADGNIAFPGGYVLVGDDEQWMYASGSGKTVVVAAMTSPTVSVLAIDKWGNIEPVQYMYPRIGGPADWEPPLPYQQYVVLEPLLVHVGDPIVDCVYRIESMGKLQDTGISFFPPPLSTGRAFNFRKQHYYIADESSSNLRIWLYDFSSSAEILPLQYAEIPARVTSCLSLSYDGTMLAAATGGIALLGYDQLGNLQCGGAVTIAQPAGARQIKFLGNDILLSHSWEGPMSFASYRIKGDYTGSLVDSVGDWDNGAFQLTPDLNFALVLHSPIGPYQTFSVVRVYHDGQLEKLDKDLLVSAYFGDYRFIPPQVLAGYYPWAAGRASWEEDFSGWTSGGGGFDSPKFDRTSTGTLVIAPTSSNCFGYWQSPVDACMVVPYSLYRARFVLQGAGSDGTKAPGIRLRANAQTFQQADTLSINSLGDAHLSPTLTPTTYTLFLEPPISSCSRPENEDDVFLSLDLMAFDPADDVGTTFTMSYCVVDRYPVDALTSWTVVREYGFETSAEGWATGGAPGVYTEPTYIAWPSALILKATNNTNCFGYWHSNSADIVASTCGELYRATFELHTDITDRAKVPEIRFRINTEDGMLGVSQSINSTIDSEMSPYFDPAHPSRTFKYNICLWKPAASYQDKLILSIDLLNFSASDSASGSIMLDSARISTHPLPKFPMDDPSS